MAESIKTLMLNNADNDPLTMTGEVAMKKDYIEYVPVLETHNAGDRVFIKSILDAEGIIYFIQGEHVAPYLFNALPMRVMVKKDQADRARDILKDINLSYSYGIR